MDDSEKHPEHPKLKYPDLLKLKQLPEFLKLKHLPEFLKLKHLPRQRFRLLLLLPLLMVTIITLQYLRSISVMVQVERSEQTPEAENCPPLIPPPPIVRLTTGPAIAYAICGSTGDVEQMLRLVKAVYHPRNSYLLHLDKQTPAPEHEDLATRVSQEPLYAQVKNVHIVPKPNLVTANGATMLALALHQMAILLLKNDDWDWFVQLTAAHYPLLRQDDILYALGKVPRSLNFLQYTSGVDPNDIARARNVVYDKGLSSNESSIAATSFGERAPPENFRLFSGSKWMMLSRDFCTYCVHGSDNLPRTLLMYFANYASCDFNYFQTLICNSPEFSNTTVNTNFRIGRSDPATQVPGNSGIDDFGNLTSSGMLFASKFEKDSAMLDELDSRILHRSPAGFTPGGWCAETTEVSLNPELCNNIGNVSLLRPDADSLYFESFLTKIISQQLWHQERYKCQ